ncbi:MAG: VOC family protein [Acidimicrobiales bacterium]
MLERTDYPAGVPCWVDTAQPDPAAAADFYAALFGWELEDRVPPEAPGHCFIARLDGRDVAAVGSPASGLPTDPIWSMYVAVARADEAARAVEAAGGTVLVAPADVGDAGRMAVCADPSGATFDLWEGHRRKGAQVVNEPGAWNFNELHTDDPDRSRSFYGSVFDWEAVDLDFGGAVSTMWCRPGYGDHLQSIDPDLESRHRRESVPPGFADCVGWLQPLDDEVSRPHWGTTFAVGDTDAVAQRALELGGTVLSPPTDAGVVRVATIRDPQGATFTASHFDPASA